MIKEPKMSQEAWFVFAKKAGQFARGKRTSEIVAWAKAIDSVILNHHTHFALAEMDDLIERPSHVEYERLHAVSCLFTVIGFRSGADSLNAYLRVYLGKKHRRGM